MDNVEFQHEAIVFDFFACGDSALSDVLLLFWLLYSFEPCPQPQPVPFAVEVDIDSENVTMFVELFPCMKKKCQ